MSNLTLSGDGSLGSPRNGMVPPPAMASSTRSSSEKFVLACIAGIITLYCVALWFEWPQVGTAMINGHAIAAHAVEAEASHSVEAPAPAHEIHAKLAAPPLYMVAPFVVLLGCIAVLPLFHRTEHWWESNLHRFYVAAGLGLATLLYYALMHHHPIERHFLGHALVDPGEGWLSWAVPWTIVQNALFNEYVPFLMLLFSLYTISGGIRIEADLPAHPVTNTAFIGLGGLLASFIGTTGAAMLLIRPLLETNHQRKRVRHTVIFFIFVVCNCGGCLLPIGDPPLFLGYLQGVDFFWTLSLWKEWLAVNLALLAIYYVWDHFFAYAKESREDVRHDEVEVRFPRVSGWWPNVVLLFGVVASVAFLDPSKPVPFTNWHPWIYLRELAQLVLVGFSLFWGSQKVRLDNRFNYGAIIEVAALFLGIFICMQPALQLLEVHGAALGVDTAGKFYWFTGGLSSVLDNAPTYLVFFKTAEALGGGPGAVAATAGIDPHLLSAVSLGAVFMGAMTYIGNGPNFMVKAIAESSGVRMPSFFGYMAYSVGVLLPVLAIAGWIFLM